MYGKVILKYIRIKVSLLSMQDCEQVYHSIVLLLMTKIFTDLIHPMLHRLCINNLSANQFYGIKFSDPLKSRILSRIFTAAMIFIHPLVKTKQIYLS